MKKIFILALLLASITYAYSQNIVTGKVVDDKGNPVLGAKITDSQTGISTITGVDGSFLLNTNTAASHVEAEYVGYKSVSQKAEDGMLIQLSTGSWWNSKAEKFWFVGVQGLFPERFHPLTVIPGIEFGWVNKKYGFYGKGFYMPAKDSSLETNLEYTDYWFTGKRHIGMWAFTAGVIARLNCPIYFYLGAGYGERNVQYQLYKDDWVRDTRLNWFDSFLLEAGLRIKLKHLMINAGTIVNMGDLEDYTLETNERFMVNVGINYCF